MVAIHDGPLYWRRLHQVLRHVGWAQVRAARLDSQLGLNIDT